MAQSNSDHQGWRSHWIGSHDVVAPKHNSRQFVHRLCLRCCSCHPERPVVANPFPYILANLGFTLGFGALVLNGLMLWLGSMFIEGVTFDGLLSYIPAAFGIALINTIISSLLTIDDDVSNYRNVLHRRMHTEEKENLSASILASSF